MEEGILILEVFSTYIGIQDGGWIVLCYLLPPPVPVARGKDQGETKQWSNLSGSPILKLKRCFQMLYLFLNYTKEEAVGALGLAG